MPYHMIGARNMESAILGGYVDHVMELHPDAPLPGVYLADEIFKNAEQHRQRLGDEKFFEDLNQGNKAAGGSGWGKLATGWNAARFDAALEAPPSSEERSRLVGDLVQYIFPAFRGIAQGKDEAYVDLDVGLSDHQRPRQVARLRRPDPVPRRTDPLAGHALGGPGLRPDRGEQAGQAGRVPQVGTPGADHQLRGPPA